MKKIKLSLTDYQLFLFKLFLFLALAWTGFLSALLGVFYPLIIWALFAAASIWMIRNLKEHGVSMKLSLEMWTASIIFFLVSALFVSFSTPTVFSGRDQGSISEAAVRLAENNTLKFSTPASKEFFKIYGPGRALNFPGFYYTENGDLTTQFPLVYIAWLALFYAIFGITGFAVANGVLLFFFFLSFYLLLRLFLKTSSAIPGVLFAATSFVFIWFSKFTLSENMALSLLWIAILSLIFFLHSPRRLSYTVLLMSIFLLCFTRIEGYGSLIVFSVVLLANKDSRNFIKSKLSYRFFIPAGFFITVFLINFLQDISFYTEIGKTLLPEEVTSAKAQPLGTMKNTVLPNFYMEKIFHIYGLLGFFVFGAVGAMVQVFRKEMQKLVPLFIVAPTLIYFLNSHITLDHPWMLRRFMFSLLPLAVFYSGLIIGELLEKRLTDRKNFFYVASATVLVALLIFSNLPASFKFLAFSENKTLLAQTQDMSSKFSPNDLVLIDREATGDGWTMISGPMSFLMGKNSVYFFNTQDLSKLDLNAFDNVYLIAPNSQVPYYLNSTIGSRLTEESDYKLAFSKLNMAQSSPLKTVEFPEKKVFEITGKIFKVAKQQP